MTARPKPFAASGTRTARSDFARFLPNGLSSFIVAQMSESFGKTLVQLTQGVAQGT